MLLLLLVEVMLVERRERSDMVKVSSPVETNVGWNSTQGRLELHRWAGKGPTMSS